jgi:hypothetical protein
MARTGNPQLGEKSLAPRLTNVCSQAGQTARREAAGCAPGYFCATTMVFTVAVTPSTTSTTTM